MRTYLRALAFLTIVAIAFPLLAADEQKKDADKPAADKAEAKKDVAKKDDEAKKDDDKKDPEKKAEKKPKLTYGSMFMGKVKQMDANSQRQFTVEITKKVAIPNQQAMNQAAQQQMQYQQQQLQYQQRWAQIMNNRNPVQRQQQLYQLQMQIAQSQAQAQARPPAQLYTYKDEHQDVLLKAAEDIRVRLQSPPVDYDDKGNLKKYTAKELQALKGSENLPGYTGEMEALHVGQYVQVYLAKPAPKQQPKKGAGGKADKQDPAIPGLGGGQGAVGGLKLNDDDAALAGPPRHEVVMIVILGESQQQPGR